MARSDLLVNLIKAGSTGNEVLFKNTVDAIIAEEKSKQHHVLVDKLLESYKKSSKISSMNNFSKHSELFHQASSNIALENIMLAKDARLAVNELIEEHQRSELLRSYGLEPKNRVLLVGPPGNGKTSLASAIADKLMVPIYTINYSGIIGSYLGETTSRLAKLLEEIRTQRCVLFIDEFETIAKERGDKNETGEIKRVVSSLLLEIDKLPSHVIVIAASNHPELLDRAIWRRFPLKLDLVSPSLSEVQEYIFDQLRDFAPREKTKMINAAQKLNGLSYSDIENFCMDVKRRIVLSDAKGNFENILNQQLSRLKVNDSNS